MRSPFWNLSTSAIALYPFFSTKGIALLEFVNKGDRSFGLEKSISLLF
ncbi:MULTISPECIES: hypothetical protein [unclassified Microcoleus]